MIRTLTTLFRKRPKPSWTPADERALQDAKAHHERSAPMAKAKAAAVHAQLATEVWGSRANGWRGTR